MSNTFHSKEATGGGPSSTRTEDVGVQAKKMKMRGKPSASADLVKETVSALPQDQHDTDSDDELVEYAPYNRSESQDDEDSDEGTQRPWRFSNGIIHQRFPKWVINLIKRAIGHVPLLGGHAYYRDVLKFLIQHEQAVTVTRDSRPDKRVLLSFSQLSYGRDPNGILSEEIENTYQCSLRKFQEKVKRLKIALRGRKKFSYSSTHVEYLLKLYDELNFSKNGRRNENSALICERFLQAFPDIGVTSKAVQEKLKKVTKNRERVIRPKI